MKMDLNVAVLEDSVCAGASGSQTWPGHSESLALRGK